MPAGWSIYRSDREMFRVPAGRVITYGICAVGPAQETALVIAVGEANAYRHFARFMSGGFEVSEGWAVPLDAVDPREPHAHFGISADDDPDVIAAKRELDESLPPGWEPFDSDRERYFFPSGRIETWAIAASGPGGEGALAMGLGEAGGLRQVARFFRGELEIADAWAPPMERLRKEG